jgi:hypothetical protein
MDPISKQLLNQGSDRRYESSALCSEQNTQGTSQGQSQPSCVTPCQPFVNDHQVGTQLLCQSNHFRFAAIEIREYVCTPGVLHRDDTNLVCLL